MSATESHFHGCPRPAARGVVLPLDTCRAVAAGAREPESANPEASSYPSDGARCYVPRPSRTAMSSPRGPSRYFIALALLLVSCGYADRSRQCRRASAALATGLSGAPEKAANTPASVPAWRETAIAYRDTAAHLEAGTDVTQPIGAALLEEARLLRRAAQTAEGLAAGLEREDSRSVANARNEMARHGSDHQRQLDRLRKLCLP